MHLLPQGYMGFLGVLCIDMHQQRQGVDDKHSQLAKNAWDTCTFLDTCKKMHSGGAGCVGLGQ